MTVRERRQKERKEFREYIKISDDKVLDTKKYGIELLGDDEIFVQVQNTECYWISNYGRLVNNMRKSKATVALQRYAVKDWGNLDDEDKQTNEDALNYPDDLYVMGAYDTSKGKIWIITNRISEKAGENATTVCFPDER